MGGTVREQQFTGWRGREEDLLDVTRVQKSIMIRLAATAVVCAVVLQSHKPSHWPAYLSLNRGKAEGKMMSNLVLLHVSQQPGRNRLATVRCWSFMVINARVLSAGCMSIKLHNELRQQRSYICVRNRITRSLPLSVSSSINKDLIKTISPCSKGRDGAFVPYDDN